MKDCESNLFISKETSAKKLNVHRIGIQGNKGARGDIVYVSVCQFIIK